MKLTYSSLKDNDLFVLTDFSCHDSYKLLAESNLYKILWSTKNDMRIMVDHYELSLGINEVLFCTPMNIIEFPSEENELMSIVFNKEFFCIQTHDEQVSCNGLLFFGSSEPQVISLSSKDIQRFDTIYSMFKEDLNIKDHLQGEMLRSTLKRMLIHSTRMVKSNLPQPSISNSNLNLIREYNLLVEQHFRKLHNVKDYANLLFKSPKTLSNLFPKYSDKSPLEVINDRILLEAKRLLIYSNQSTAEISEELGYKDPGHFSKFFKNHVGQSPSIFRKHKLMKV